MVLGWLEDNSRFSSIHRPSPGAPEGHQHWAGAVLYRMQRRRRGLGSGQTGREEPLIWPLSSVFPYPVLLQIIRAQLQSFLFLKRVQRVLFFGVYRDCHYEKHVEIKMHL